VRILFDQGTPVPLRRYLAGHEVETAFERGWSTLENGDLLDMAERAGFVVLVTTDSNLKYQQSLSHRRIAIVVLSTTSWPRIRHAARAVAQAIGNVTESQYAEIAIP
jgi:predicted nuclease of predicted toxin-antitoxin system